MMRVMIRVGLCRCLCLMICDCDCLTSVVNEGEIPVLLCACLF
jgi:hypothetical protein